MCYFTFYKENIFSLLMLSVPTPCLKDLGYKKLFESSPTLYIKKFLKKHFF